MPIPERITIPGEPEPKDPSKKHFYISIIKSVVRIVAGVYLFYGNYAVAGSLFIAAEVLGVIEEL